MGTVHDAIDGRLRAFVERVSDSCGYGLPLMEPVGERHLLPEHMERKGHEGLLDYRRLKNRTSIDGLPAFDDDPV